MILWDDVNNMSKHATHKLKFDDSTMLKHASDMLKMLVKYISNMLYL